MISNKKLYFEENYTSYDKWYEEHPQEYEDQVEFISSLLPFGNGVEIGVGTGRFALRLGISTGVDTSENMARLARERGIKAIVADAVKLPFKDKEFDFSLNMVTICFLDDPLKSIKEAKRVSKVVVTVILDRDSEYIRDIIAKKTGFYKYAKFYNEGELVDLYGKAGFREIVVKEDDLMTSEGKKYRLVGVVGK